MSREYVAISIKNYSDRDRCTIKYYWESYSLCYIISDEFGTVEEYADTSILMEELNKDKESGFEVISGRLEVAKYLMMQELLN